VEGLVHALNLTSMSNVQVSDMAKELDKELDEVAASFRNRPLDQTPYTCF
jgi:transposase-like protein